MNFFDRRLRKAQQYGLQERAYRNNAGHESASCNREAAQLGFPGPEAALVPEGSTARHGALDLLSWCPLVEDYDSACSVTRMAGTGLFMTSRNTKRAVIAAKL